MDAILRIEIVTVEKHECEFIITNEKYMNKYRRLAPEHWMHKLGVYGWHRYLQPDLLEDAYQIFMRENGAKPTKPNL